MPNPPQASAFATVTGATGAMTSGYGFSASARNGAGDYTLTLTQEADATECQIVVSPRTAVSQWRVVHTSDSAKQVLLFNAAGAATDGDFTVSLTRFLP